MPKTVGANPFADKFVDSWEANLFADCGAAQH
jgi:hypothetical protein